MFLSFFRFSHRVQVVLAWLVVGFVAVVFAGREGVGAAALVQCVVGAGDDALLDPVLPGGQRLAPVATENPKKKFSEKL